MNPEPRWISAPLEVVGSMGMALLLLLDVCDLHSPRMIACNATPTPVMAADSGPEPPGHLEQTGGALAPDHAPALLVHKKRVAPPDGLARLRVNLSIPTGCLESPVLLDVPQAPTLRARAARAPPTLNL